MHENGETFSSKDLKGEKGQKEEEEGKATSYPKMSCRKCGEMRFPCNECNVTEEDDECECQEFCARGGECEPESESADSNGPGTGH